jgi:hypothetical protein
MTIADTLYDAADDIRGYIEDDTMYYTDELKDEIMGIVAVMDALREKIDVLGKKPSSRGNFST